MCGNRGGTKRDLRNCKNGTMRIVFAGTPEFAVPSLRALVDAGHDVVEVITREDARVGRKRVLTPSPVALAANELGIGVYKTNRLDDSPTDRVESLNVDLGVIVAYGGFVREPLLSLPTHGWINLHFSDLPRWRGAAPVQRALMAGESRLGVTVFRLVEALDAGDVLTRDTRTFPPGTSAGLALTQLAHAGTQALLAAVETLEAHSGAGEPQHGETTYAHKLTREDGRLDLQQPAVQVLAHWAGVTPEPGAFVTHEGQPLKLHEVVPAAGRRDAARGTVELIEDAAILHLGDGDAAALELLRVQPAGKPVMDGVAWLRGRGGKADLA